MKAQFHQPSRAIGGNCPDCGKVIIVFNEYEAWPLMQCSCGWCGATDSVDNYKRLERAMRATGKEGEVVKVRVALDIEVESRDVGYTEAITYYIDQYSIDSEHTAEVPTDDQAAEAVESVILDILRDELAKLRSTGVVSYEITASHCEVVTVLDECQHCGVPVAMSSGRWVHHDKATTAEWLPCQAGLVGNRKLTATPRKVG